jgi:LPS O-antigen subunit length determinant protein (WzzB/FepE family)
MNTQSVELNVLGTLSIGLLFSAWKRNMYPLIIALLFIAIAVIYDILVHDQIKTEETAQTQALLNNVTSDQPNMAPLTVDPQSYRVKYVNPGIFEYADKITQVPKPYIPDSNEDLQRMYNRADELHEGLIMHPVADPTGIARQPTFNDDSDYKPYWQYDGWLRNIR